VLPAKHYHVLASVYAACFLVQRNIPSPLIRELSERAVNAYRAGRLCEIIANYEGEDLIGMLKKTGFHKLTNNCHGLQITHGVRTFLDIFSSPFNANCYGELSEESCQKAKNMAKTWAIDFEW